MSKHYGVSKTCMFRIFNPHQLDWSNWMFSPLAILLISWKFCFVLYWSVLWKRYRQVLIVFACFFNLYNYNLIFQIIQIKNFLPKIFCSFIKICNIFPKIYLFILIIKFFFLSFWWIYNKIFNIHNFEHTIFLKI